MGQNIAKVAVSVATFHIDRPYDYEIPGELAELAVPGMRVIVPFGRGNGKSEGIILSLAAGSGRKVLKSIDSLVDEAPVLGEESIRLALWMSDRFFCTVFDAFRAMLPAGMWAREGAGRQGDKTISVAVMNVTGKEADELAVKKQKAAPRQAEILEVLAGAGSMTVKDVCFSTGASANTVRALENQGIIKIEKQEVFRRPAVRALPDPGPIELNGEQSAAFGGLAPLLRSGKAEAALLYGVTGSGKTLVYIRLIGEALALGRTAIVLVPEISLTPQTVSIFTAYFGDRVAVLHSALGTGERYDEWKRIRSGAVKVVVGTRSAVFAPLSGLGLIVIDEEQEHTYKSEVGSRYHAREVAKFRVALAGALLLLTSATPSVESMHHAKEGRYRLFRIGSRYNEQGLPDVRIADMKQELKAGNGGSISSVLGRELEANLSCGEQSILFINRRGTNPLVACGECGYTFRCKKCSVSMTYHAAKGRLICHYCGFSQQVPEVCPDCGGKLKFTGAGTQKVESELLELFPGIGIIRMDADTVSRINSHDRLLSKFREGKADVLLGTQMVTKGLDFENVTLVGVLSADSSLYMSDYRAHERTFSLITQVVGRSGRGEKPGRAVIQTFTPEHDVIRLASRQDYDGFYEREMVLRRTLRCPPVRDLLTLAAIGADEQAVIASCAVLRGALESYFSGDGGITVLGPAPAPVTKVNNRYRYRLIVRCENTKRVRDTVAHTVREFSRDRLGREVAVFADADVYD